MNTCCNTPLQKEKKKEKSQDEIATPEKMLENNNEREKYDVPVFLGLGIGTPNIAVVLALVV